MALRFLSVLLLLFAALSSSFAAEGDTGALPDSAANGVQNPVIPSPRVTIRQFIKDSDSHNVLEMLIALFPGVAQPLGEPGTRLTIFAPTDDAFAALARGLLPTVDIDNSDPASIIKALGQGIELIREVPNFIGIEGILAYHALNRAYTFEATLKRRRISSMSGRNLTFVNNQVKDLDQSRDDPTPNPKNVFCLNGWVHSISSVLIPFNTARAAAIVAARPTPSPSASPSVGATAVEGSTNGTKSADKAIPAVVGPTSGSNNGANEGGSTTGGSTDGGATPTGDGATPTGDGATPTGDGSTPSGDGSTPTGDGSTTPTGAAGGGESGDGSTTTGSGTTPVSGGDVGDGTTTTAPGVDEEDEEETSEPSPEAVCFPGSASLKTLDGKSVRMLNIQAGQHVHHDENGGASPIFMFTHRTMKTKTWFYEITSASGHSVRMTGNHYLYANGRLTAAHAVEVGDRIRTASGGSHVVSVKRVQDVGLYAPHSMHGDLMVDGIVVSSYSKAVSPRIAHALLTPLRWYVGVSGTKEVLAGMFYEGGRGLEHFAPKGKARY